MSQFHKSLASFGSTACGYDSDPDAGVPRLACEAFIIKTGEAVSRVPREMRDAFPDVPWQSLADMGNFLTHQYDVTDYDLVRETLVYDLPDVHQQIRRAPGRTMT